MAFFSKPKVPPPESSRTPDTCSVCHTRVGAIALHEIRLAAGAEVKTAWVCRPCFERLRGGASTN